MMKIKGKLMFCLLSGLSAWCMAGCRQERFPETEIVFPPTLYSVSDSSRFAFSTFGEKKCLKLITVIEGDCGSCLVSLLTWGNYLKDYGKVYDSVALAAVVCTQNLFLLEYNLEQAKPKVPFYIDTLNMFYESNCLSDERLYTFLLDRDNRILYDHSPFESKREHRKILRKIRQELGSRHPE